MTDEQINKDIQEKILKKCWHELEWSDQDDCNTYYECKKCGIEQVGDKRSDYLNNWNDYGELVKMIVNHERWDAFIIDLTAYTVLSNTIKNILLYSRRGSEAVWQFFIGGGKDGK